MRRRGRVAASDGQGFGAERRDGDRSHPPCGDEAGTLLLIEEIPKRGSKLDDPGDLGHVKLHSGPVPLDLAQTCVAFEDVFEGVFGV